MKKHLFQISLFTLIFTIFFGKNSFAQCDFLVPFTGNNTITSNSGNICDHGGLGNYSDNANGFTVINPICGNVRLTFTLMNTEGAFDFVTVFDGVGVGAPVLYTGSGNVLPPVLNATAGSLTIRFTSDNSVIFPGFSATISNIGGAASPAPSPVTATPSSICAGETSQLNSTALVGNVQSWFTVPTGGVAIGTSLSGVDFAVTPAVTTTYYAENLNPTVIVPGTQTFSFTGGLQTFTVPAGVTAITILAKGAQGATGANGGGGGFGGAGGLGSSAQGILTVTPGDVLNILVGGQGLAGVGGFNGGANGGNIAAGGGGGASDVRLNGLAEANRVIVAGGAGGGGTGGCAVPNVNGGTGGHGNANGTNGVTSPNGGGGFAASGATFGAAGIGCGGFLGSPGVTATTGAGGAGGNGQGCCCASTPGGGGGGGGFIGGGGAGGGSAGTVGCSGNDKGGGGGGAGGSSFTGALLSPVLVTGIQTGNGEVVLTWTATIIGCPSVRVPVIVTVNPASPAPSPVTATPSSICAGETSQLNSTALVGNVQSWFTVPTGGVAIGTSLSGVDFAVTPAVTTTYYAENLNPTVIVPGTQTFSFTGGLQTFTVPAGVTAITILAKGAQGATGANGGGGGFGGAGGLGSSAQGILTVTPGDVLNILVGGQGLAGVGGFNGGANGGNIAAGGGGGASDVRLNGLAEANRVIVAGGAGGGGTGGCAVPNVNGGTGGHGNANGTNGVTSPNGGGGFAASGATFGAAGIGCGGFLGSPGVTATTGAGGAGGNGQGCCCASTPGGGGGGGGFIGGGGAGGGSAGTVGCSGNDKGGGGGGAGGSSFTGALLSPVLVTGIQTGNGEVVLTWTATIIGCPSVRVPVIVTVNPASPAPSPVTATPSSICAGETSQLNSTALVGNVQSWFTVPTGGVAIGTSLSGVDFAVTPAVTTTYYAENLNPTVIVPGTQTFSFTGGLQTFTVPAGVTAITILAKGAQGATGANGGGGGFGGAGGLGSSAQGILTVTPGDVLNILVGGQGLAGVGGFNGGANGGNIAAGGGGGASDVRLNGLAEANRVIVAGGAGGGGTGGCAVPNVNGGTGGHGNANGTNGVTSPNGGGGFAASGATFGAAGIGCGGFLGSPGVTATTGAGGAGGNGQGCCCASTPGGGGGGGGFIGGGGAGGGSAGTVGCSGNDKGGGGGGAGGSSFTGALLSPVLVTGIQTGNGEVVLTWTANNIGCPSVRVPVIVTVNPAPVVTATATPSTTCAQTVVTPSASGAATIGWSGGLLNNVAFIASATTTYTVTGTDGLGCNGTTTVLVTVNPMSGVLAPATSNQSQNQADDFNINYYDASCNLIATVDDGAGGNILGSTISTVNVDATAGVHNAQPFVRRWYQITPTNNGAADVILYINQSDFDNYNAGVALPYLPLPTGPLDASGIANVRITKNADAGLGNSPIVITPTVTWNALNSYWELSFSTPGFSQFRVHSVNPGNVPLPATVTYFSGMKLESSDKLSWTTSSEQNNAYFNLQHGTDGTNFTTLARLDSKAPNGNSAVTINYSAENAQPNLGHNYYRLQQVDMDGKVSVHAQIVDLIWGANGSTVSIYPNPTTDILNIDLYASKAQNTTVKLLDMSGRVIKQIQAKSAVGMNNIKLSMGEIASGVYTIQVYENNSLTHTSKVKKN